MPVYSTAPSLLVLRIDMICRMIWPSNNSCKEGQLVSIAVLYIAHDMSQGPASNDVAAPTQSLGSPSGPGTVPTSEEDPMDHGFATGLERTA